MLLRWLGATRHHVSKIGFKLSGGCLTKYLSMTSLLFIDNKLISGKMLLRTKPLRSAPLMNELTGQIHSSKENNKKNKIY